MKNMKWSRIVCAIGVLFALAASTTPSAAQGVTTAAVTGVVKDAQGAVIPGAASVVPTRSRPPCQGSAAKKKVAWP